jgi:carboxymethylenebutenolidase
MLNYMNDKSEDIADVFDEHIKCELVDKDVDATMKTMVKEPYVHLVPVLTGGKGYNEVYDFYKNHFIGRTPTDTNIVRISRTVSKDQVVDELILSFTHDIEMDYILPGIAPTGKHVEIPFIIIVKFDGGKMAHEHFYWDQASVLAQIEMIDTKGIPIIGIEQAKKLLEISRKNIETGK